jgi:hypothetical protein
VALSILAGFVPMWGEMFDLITIEVGGFVMQCPNCHHVHPAPARFCAQCGSALPGNATPGGPAPGTFPYGGGPGSQFGPGPRASTLLGLPVYVWLLGAAGIALIAMLLPWYSSTYSAQVGWQTTGYDYGAAGRSTWDVPVTSGSFSGGGNGFGFFTFVLTAAVAGLAVAFRAKAWPRWASITLAVVVGLVLLIGITNLAFDPNIGPFLFAVAGGLAAPAVIQTFRSQNA